MTTMFDSTARTDTSHKKRADSIFEYLNNSKRLGSEATRALIEDWFSRVPRDNQAEFRSRFRSGSNVELASVFQELCFHELLVRQACKLILHPTVTGTTNRPDFLVLEPDTLEFLLEAKSSTELSSGP